MNVFCDINNITSERGESKVVWSHFGLPYKFLSCCFYLRDQLLLRLLRIRLTFSTSLTNDSWFYPSTTENLNGFLCWELTFSITFVFRDGS